MKGTKYTTGAATNSKNLDRYAEGTPTMEWADGAWVGPASGGRFVDLTSGLGAVILGHQDLAVDQAALEQLGIGVAFPIATQLEETVARQLCDYLPWLGAQKVRWSKNGRDATAAAVRLARAVTGGHTCVYCDYHGSDDQFLTEPPWNAGVPSWFAGYKGDVAAVHIPRHLLGQFLADEGDQVACVLLEPVASNAPEEPASIEFFAELRRQCTEAGAMLIIDEMVTFGRMPFGSGQAAFDIQPDLWVGGKCIANGLPLTAVVGPDEFMNRFAVDVFHSMTHAGECLSLAAASATLKELVTRKPWFHCGALGTEIVQLFEEAGAEKRVRHAYPQRLMFDFTRAELGVLLKAGVLCAGYANLTLAHTEDEEARATLLAAFRTVLAK